MCTHNIQCLVGFKFKLYTFIVDIMISIVSLPNIVSPNWSYNVW